MKLTLSIWQLGGLTFTAVLGTILHFLYGLTGDNMAVAPFSAVNESTWEHMKLLFFSSLAFAYIQSFFFRKSYHGFWKIKLLGSVLGLGLIPVLFYTYNGAIGPSPAWFNVLSFFLAAGGEYLIENHLFSYNALGGRGEWLAKILLLALALAFVFFTFSPPKLPIFLDPVTGGYGFLGVK